MTKRWFGVVTGFCLLALCSCASHRQATSDLTEQLTCAFSPLIDATLASSGSVPVVYNSLSFLAKNGRWPKDYDDLATFVRNSDGYLLPGNYERVQLTQLPGDKLQVCFVRRGHTNEFRLTLGSTAK